MANVVVTETTPNITVNATSNAVTVTNTTSNITVSNVAVADIAQIRGALSVTDSGGDGSLSYNNTTGVFTYVGSSDADKNTWFATRTTDNLAEGSSNLYFTTARANSAIDTFLGSGLSANINTTGTMSATTFTANGNIQILPNAGNLVIGSNVAASGHGNGNIYFGHITRAGGSGNTAHVQGGNAQITLGDPADFPAGQLGIFFTETSTEQAIQIGSNKSSGSGGFRFIDMYEDTSHHVQLLPSIGSSIPPSGAGRGLVFTQGLISSSNVSSYYTARNTTGVDGDLPIAGNVSIGIKNGGMAPTTLLANADIVVTNGSLTLSGNGVTGVGNITTNANITGAFLFGNISGTTGTSTGITNAVVDAFASGVSSNIITTANIQGGNIIGVINSNANIDTSGTLKSSNALGLAVTGNATIGGNLNVTGNVNSANVVDLFVEDRNITLQFGTTGTPSANSQIFIDRGDETNTFIIFNESTNKWGFSNDGSNITNFAQTTTDLPEGTNLYFSNARANAAVVDTLGNVTSNISSTKTITSGRITINPTSGVTTNAELIFGNVNSGESGRILFNGNGMTHPHIFASISDDDMRFTQGGNNSSTHFTLSRVGGGNGPGNLLATLSGDLKLEGEANIAGETTLNAPLGSNSNITTTANVAGANFIGNVVGNVTGSPSSLAGLDTDDLSEGTTNKYFSTTLANSAIGAYTGNLTGVSTTGNITTTANASVNTLLTDNIESGSSANLNLLGQQNGVHINKTIDSSTSRVLDVDTTGYSLAEAVVPASTTLGASAPSILVSINHTAGSPTATVNDIYGGALAGVGLDVAALRGPGFSSALAGGDIIITAESGTAGRANLEAAMTTTGTTSPFIGSPPQSGLANASANLYGQDKGWTVFNLSNGSRSDLFPLGTHVTGVVNDTITFSQNALTTATTTISLIPGMAQSTIANADLKYITQPGSNSLVNDKSIYGNLGLFDQPETKANLTYDRISYANTSSITMTSIDTKQSADMNSGGDSAVRFPRLLSVGANTTPDPFSGREETNNPSPIGVTVEDDGETYAGNNAPYSKFLFNSYTGAFDGMSQLPNWATVGNTGNTTLDLNHLKAPSLQFKTFRGVKSDGNVSNYLMQANEVVGKIQFSPGQTTGLSFQGADLYNPPAAITVDVGSANIDTQVANTFMHITTTPFPVSNGYVRGFETDPANVNISTPTQGGAQQTNFTTKGGNVTIAAQTTGKISLAPTPDYGDSSNSSTWLRRAGSTHEYHRFLDARFNTANATSKQGTVIEIQPASGTTTGGGGLQYNSVGDAILQLTTHEANGSLLKSYTVSNDRTSNSFVIKNNASSVDALKIDDSRNTHGQTVRLHNLTTTQINALSSPQAGDMVFNTTLNQVCVYNGSAWQKLTQSAM